MRQSPAHPKLAVAFALVALFAFSGPGVVVAHAESDLAPSARELFSGNAARQVSLPVAAACDPASLEQAQQRRQVIAARLAELMLRDDGDGPGRALPNGYGYAAPRNVMLELERIQREAARLRAARLRAARKR